MKVTYSEPIIEVFVFNKPDVIRASSVNVPDEPSMGEDLVGVAGSNGDSLVW